MRRKITEAVEPTDDLPELTPQQRDFAFLIIQGKTASDAYRGAYDCSNMGDKSIWVEASRLKNDPDVALWLAAARKAELGSASRSKEQHILRLDKLQQIAIDTGNVGAAVQAEQLIGKVEGHYVDQVKDVTDDPMKTLREIQDIIGEEAASKLAQDLETRH